MLKSLSFRNRLFLGLLSLALMTALSSVGLGYVSFRRALNTDINLSIDAAKDLAKNVIDFSGPSPRLQLSRQTNDLFQTLGEVRFRLRQGERAVLFYGGSYPENDAGWRQESLPLETFSLDIALNVEDKQLALRTYLNTGLLSLFIALVIALIMGRLLYRIAMNPIRDLTAAVNVLSHQRIPKPVEVNQGNDELSQLALSFNRMSEALARFLQRERAFTRYASHELNTPLSNIKVLTEGVKQNLYKQEEIQTPVEESILHIEDILRGLLSMTRFSDAPLEPILLVAAIESALKGLCTKHRRRLTFTNHVHDDLIVMGHDDLIQQVITNLLSNAFKYSKDDVKLELTKFESKVCIHIKDKGLGVPEEKLNKLTEPFFRHHKQRDGLGLGLALVQHVIDALQGTVNFQNVEDGFEVVVRLPLMSVETLA